jgi:endonuclease YncB( thermonuclease family)
LTATFLDVDLDGRTERIRLLNVDTPETKDPNEAVQCLGPEAAAATWRRTIRTRSGLGTCGPRSGTIVSSSLDS